MRSSYFSRWILILFVMYKPLHQINISISCWVRWWTCCHSQKSALECINQSNVDRLIFLLPVCIAFATTTTIGSMNDKNKVIYNINAKNQVISHATCNYECIIAINGTWCDLGRHPIICYVFMLQLAFDCAAKVRKTHKNIM